MSNCLVTKLDLVVDNDNMYVIGALCIRVKGGTTFLLTSATAQTAKILTEGVTFTGGTQEYAVTTSASNTTSVSGDCVVLVPNKTELTRIGYTDAGSEMAIIGGYRALAGCTKLTRISFNKSYNPGGVKYDLTELPSAFLTSLQDTIPPFNVVVDTSVLGTMTKFRQPLILPSLVKGDVANLDGLTLVPRIDLSGCSELSGDISVFGSMPLTSLLLNDSPKLQGNVNTALSELTSLTTINVNNDPLITGSASQLRSSLPNLTTFNYSGSGITA